MDAKKKAESRAKSNANLRPKPPINERPPEEQLEIRRKGQRASLEVVRRKKAIKDICTELLSMRCPEGAATLGKLEDSARDAARGRGEPLDVYEAGVLAQVARMLAGDTRAAEFVRDSAGDKPTDKVQADVASVTAADLELLHKLDQSGELERLAARK